MCKILMISNYKKFLKYQNTNKSNAEILNKIKEIVTLFNDDGFGFSMSSTKNIYYYKQLDVRHDVATSLPDYDASVFGKNLNCETNIHEIDNNFLAKINFAIFHGRTSTNDIGLDYCHPFNILDSKNKVDASMVHNGVIDLDDESFMNIDAFLKTTNDSEMLCHHFNKTLEKGFKDIMGYFAFYNIRKDSMGKIICDVVKDNEAPQYALKINDFYIFATKSEMIIELLVFLKLDRLINAIVEIRDFTYFTLDINSNITMSTTFKKNEYRYNYSKKELRAKKDYINTVESDWKNEVKEYEAILDEENYDELYQAYTDHIESFPIDSDMSFNQFLEFYYAASVKGA